MPRQIPDYRFQNEVPFGSIIDALASKRTREAQLEQFDREKQQSRINQIRQVAQDTSSMVQGFVDASKARQKRDAMNAYQELVGQASSLVDEGGQKIPSLSLDQTPTLEGGQLETKQVPYSSTPAYKAKELAMLFKINPQEYTKQALEKQFSERGVTGSNALNTTYTPEQISAIVSGDVNRINQSFGGNVPVEALRRTQQALQQGGVQSRFETKIESGREEKGAAEKAKTQEEVNKIAEAKNLVNQMLETHQALFESNLAGDPVTAAATGFVGRITGGRYGTAPAVAYDKNRNGMVTRLKSAVGQSGVLSDQDTLRLDQLLPARNEHPDVAKGKAQQIIDILTLSETKQIDRLDQYLRDLGIKTQFGPRDKKGGSTDDKRAALRKKLGLKNGQD